MNPNTLPGDVLEFCDLLKARCRDCEQSGRGLSQDEVIETAVNRLKRRAAEAWEGSFVALSAPVAPKTWETRVRFQSNTAESNLGTIKYPRPVEIVGFVPTVVAASFAAQPPLVIPNNDDILIQIAWDQETKITTTQPSQTITTSAAEEAFVTSTATGILAARLIGLRLTTPQPQLQVKWRWKQGPNVFVDSFVSLATAVRFL